MYCCLCPHVSGKNRIISLPGMHKKARHPKRMPCPISCTVLSVLDYAEQDACHKQCEQDIESLSGEECLE